MEVVFTFHTTHAAISGERVLLENGVKVKVMPLPSSLGAGCGLCLRVDDSELEKSRQLMAAENIEPEDIYDKTTEQNQTLYRRRRAGPGPHV
ncbi:hypothetical protein C4J81_03945 [Deltaproteobacteria bacterium Smac51]|nr:hypothetical protein C4J81_03945 [Deltaproteobacteria bacterium Smac51]